RSLIETFPVCRDVLQHVSTVARLYIIASLHPVSRIPSVNPKSKHPPPFRLATLKNLKIPTIPNLTTSRKSHARTGQTEPRPRQSPLFWRTSNSEFHYNTKKPRKNRPNGIDLAF
ncbi:MAG: hypothetical protein J6X51_03570, partial [Bacteroidales bacterium]|nr:hypothetical protein [Bacteroidales bacterium]